MDPDYHLALLLQKQFDYEDNGNDHQVALLIQEQFSREYSIDKVGPSLACDSGNNSSKNIKLDCDRSKSLVDPSWELIDPTPNVHALFVAFNERFFWNKLLSVCVLWSKRMTSCAGVCSYSPRGGMCQITLSEPLLKLRPRKDLVETLLHEMIHAYLFVTRNNRDRDGHGPEFHKHMFRINAEAGTNITVYHNFHDEVRLYQQHWWRCNGPCRDKKPFFGTVRRATNRAPGPNDRWWALHAQTCGGTFIKVKEPDKKTVIKNVGKTKKINEDIRKFIPSTKVIALTKGNTSPDQAVPFNNQISTGKISTGSYIRNPVTPKSRPVKPIVKITSSAIVVRKNTTATMPQTDAKSTTSSSYSISSSSISNAFNITRNHWANKFNNKGSQNDDSNGIKRPMLEKNDFETKSQKVKKGELCSPQHLLLVKCPICSGKYSPIELDNHLDTCVKEDRKLKECVICGAQVEELDYEDHTKKCVEENFKDDFTVENSVPEKKITRECFICSELINENMFDIHVAKCRQKQNTVVDLTNDESVVKLCPICEKNISESVFETHVEICLSSFFDDMEKVYSNSQTTKCLSCNKDVLKSELNRHLEECMVDIFTDDSSSHVCDSDKDKLYTCPVCLKLFSEVDMNCHIEQCLNTNDNPESHFDKNVFSSVF